MTRRVSNKGLAVAAVLVALLLAGVVSYYASGDPDGLSRVAEDQGMAEQQRESAASSSPLADYSADSVEDDRLSNALAGVVGVGVVLLLAGSLAYVVRRRTGEQASVDDERVTSGRGEPGTGRH